MAVTRYTHVEEEVTAWKLSAETQTEIVEALMTEAAHKLLKTLVVTYNEELGHYEFEYRYHGDTVSSVLTSGNYFVKLNAGNYAVYTASEFESQYINTSVDENIPAGQRSTALGAFAKMVAEKYSDVGVTTADDFNMVTLVKAAQAVKDEWFNADQNQVTVSLSDMNITMPDGLSDIIKAIASTDYVNSETVYLLKFCNGTTENDTPNQFNYIGLMNIIAEMRSLGSKLARKVTGAQFRSVTADAKKAVAASVTDSQWNSFVAMLQSVTGITNFNAVTR